MTAKRLQELEKILRMTVVVPTSGKLGPLSSELLVRRRLAGMVEQVPKDVTSEYLHRILGPQLESHLHLSSERSLQSYERLELLLFLVSMDCRDAEFDAHNFSTGIIRSGGSIIAPRARPLEELDGERWGESIPGSTRGYLIRKQRDSQNC